MDIKIIVVTHKPYWLPQDHMYLPVQVGSADAIGITRDDTGDNIACKNANYCELTALYWAWKNLRADYIGLAHYRRHFANSLIKPGDKRAALLTEQRAEALLKGSDVLLPKPRHYWIETNYSQYAHAHHAVDLDTTRAIVAERCPEYLADYDRVMRRRSGHRFNMFIMKRDLLDAYCAWLFDILFELERRLDISGYSAQDRRVFGYVGERLLDVWLAKHGVGYKNVPYIFMEKQNWLKKGADFLARKLSASGTEETKSNQR